MATGPPFGVYVHIPFCRARCDYCAFATYTDRDHLMESYAAACRVELGRARVEEGMPPASSVFFGGGTPSRLPADLLAGILEAVPRRPGAEVTVECNPEDADPTRLAAYRAAGVTRISLGVQSTVPHVLAGLGRRHGSDHAVACGAGGGRGRLQSWSMDLIIGGRGRDRRRLGAEPRGRARAWSRPPPHLSAYSLTVEPGTPLAAAPDRHPDDDTQAGGTNRRTAPLRAGYRWEEISNWARPGHECRHNGLYWDQGDYRGSAPPPTPTARGRRWWNVRTPDRYVAAVEAGRPVRAGGEVLSDQQRRFEALALSPAHPRRRAAGRPARAPELEGLVDRSRRSGRAHRPRPAAGQRGDGPPVPTSRRRRSTGRGRGEGPGASRYDAPHA